LGKDDDKTPKIPAKEEKKPIVTIRPNKTVKVREGDPGGETRDKRL
jgi:ribosomal protein S30